MRQDSYVFLRYSIQVFNTQDDLDKLYRALKEVISQTDLLKV